MSIEQTSTVDIFILDKAYKISCPPNEQDNLRRAALYLDRKMRDIRGSGKMLGLERIAVIAALNISHELLGLKQQGSESPVSADAINQLIVRMEQTLADTAAN
jgi:cell division protein ZapA